MPVDRLHHADPREHHRAIIFRGLGYAMRCGLRLFHLVLGLRDLLCKPRDGVFERQELLAVRQDDRLIEAARPAHRSR